MPPAKKFSGMPTISCLLCAKKANTTWRWTRLRRLRIARRFNGQINNN
ncbi:nesp114 [Neophasia sp. alphabaculovirus]|nr:nesp114 [Neophasia sp. alphabaculovirus]